MFDAYFIGYSRSGSTTIELIFHAHPQIQQSMKMRLFVRDSIYPERIDEALQLYSNDGRIKIESDEEVIGNDLLGDYRLILKRAQKHNPNIKIIITLRAQESRIISEYVNELIAKDSFLTFKQWLNTPRGHTVVRSSNYYQRIYNIFKMFGRENVYILVLEKLVQEPLKEINKLFDFLGVDRTDESFLLKINNPSPSPISIIILSCYNKSRYALMSIKNLLRPVSFPLIETNLSADISSLSNCIDNEELILKSDNRYRPHIPAMKYIYLPFLNKVDKQLSNICDRLRFKYPNPRYKLVISRAYHDSNRRLEKLIGMDLSCYGY
jgi:hypothetical protein